MSAETHHPPQASHWADKYAEPLADFSLNQAWLDFETAIEIIGKIEDPALPGDVKDAIARAAQITAEGVREEVPVIGQPVRDWNDIDTRNRALRFSTAESELSDLHDLLIASYAGITDPNRRNEVTPGLSPTTKMAIDSLVEATRNCLHQFDAVIPAPLSSLWGGKRDRDREHGAWAMNLRTWQVLFTAANIYDAPALLGTVDRLIASLADENTRDVRLWVQCQPELTDELWASAWMVHKRQGGPKPPQMPEWARRTRKLGDIEQALSTGDPMPEITACKDDVLRDLHALRDWLAVHTAEPSNGEKVPEQKTNGKIGSEAESNEEGRSRSKNSQLSVEAPQVRKRSMWQL